MILKKYKKEFFITFILSLIYCSGLIIAGMNYLDDYGRYLGGYTGWSINGRPFADLLMTAFNFGSPLLDLSPLPLIMSLMILSVSGLIITSKFLTHENVYIRSVVAFLLIANPFFLENLSFKYDILPMSLSILALSLAFYKTSIYKVDFLLPIFLIFVSLGLYQASLGIFIILSILEFTEFTIKIDKSFKSCLTVALTRCIQFLLAYFLYKIIIAQFCVAGEYSLNLAKTIPFNADGMTTVLNNFYKFNFFIGNYINSMPKALVVWYILVLAGSICLLIKKVWKHSKNLFVVVALFTSPLLFYFFSFAHFLILENTVTTSRVMVSFGATLIALASYIIYAFKNEKIKLLIFIPFILYSYVLSMSYVNASISQIRKDERIISSIQRDIVHLSPRIKYVNFNGEVSSAPQKALAITKFPVLKDLTKSYLGTDWSAYMLTYNGIDVIRKYFSTKEKKTICSQPALVETSDYTINSDGENMIVSFGVPCQ
ncbi:glucosyltransferase domain-containing protein [Enterobacter sp. C2]|uniref:glucosyltransferase domain-containing protein n=1 Tax=Enterobacter sp. C2 TaxID=2870346 RepID=UPI001CA3B163|nr:glucosyltransferase domain-containing protein [Enterobacter sp. C2]